MPRKDRFSFEMPRRPVTASKEDVSAWSAAPHNHARDSYHRPYEPIIAAVPASSRKLLDPFPLPDEVLKENITKHNLLLGSINRRRPSRRAMR